MSGKTDLYDVLGVDSAASDDDIKKAYKKKMKQYHPDLNPDNPEAEEKMKEVNAAYDILSDADKKARYDQYGDDGTQQGGYGGGFEGGDFGDIFDMFFGGGGGRNAQRNANMARQGNDMRIDLRVTFAEAAKGTKREVEIGRSESCGDCGGSGAASGTGKKTCPNCGGQGRVRVTQTTPFGQFQSEKTCPKCSGKGTVIDTPCPTCQGGGRVTKKRKVDISIPAGVDNDSRLRMSGEGEGGYNGGPAGDLYIYISVAPHSYFKRSGDDITCDLSINYVQAAMGAKVQVETLDGFVNLTIPEGTQTGTIFRIAGKGFPKLRGYGKGDQKVKVIVKTPTKLTAEQKELFKLLEATLEVEAPKASPESSEKPKSKAKKGLFDKIKDKI